MRRRRLLTLAAVTGVLALSGCSGSGDEVAVPEPTNVDLGRVDIQDEAGNGLWYLAGADALDVVVEAMRDAGPVTVEGRLVESIPHEDAPPSQGRVLQVSAAGSPTEYRATITAADQQVEVIVVDGVGYLRGNAAYAERIGLPEAAQGFVCVTGDDPLVREWQDLTDAPALLDTLLAASELSVTEPAEDAETLQLVVGAGGAPIGALTVAATGEPLPSDLVVGDVSGDVSLTFTGWGEPVAVEAPEELAIPCE